MIPDGAPDIIPIPAGFFWMGSEYGPENEMPRHRVWLDRYGIGKYPVTNKDFQTFVQDSGSPAPSFWSDPVFSHPEQPVVGVSWYDATVYCAWLLQCTGKPFRLPTEAERERAARGGREHGLYPWGDKPPSERSELGYDTVTGGPQSVGTNAPNDFGLHDMSEGVHEWCSDYYDPHYYLYAPEKNPKGPPSGGRRASRGGSWRHRIKFSRCAARSSLPPDFKYADYGFRLALTLL